MRVAALLVLVGAIAVSSCGGGRPRLSYPELQRRASAICLRYQHALAKLGPPVTLTSIAKVARGAGKLGAQERKQLRQLESPADEARRYAGMIGGFVRADALLPSVEHAARAKKITAARKLLHHGRTEVIAANRDAVAIGLLDCRRR